MSTAMAMNTPTPGSLASNGMTIMCLTKAVRSGESAFSTAPPLIAETLKKGAWRHWIDAGGPHQWGEDQFEDFVRANPPEGLGVTPDVLEALLKPDSEAWVLFQEAKRRRRGASLGDIRNPTGINRDNITVNPLPDHEPDILPLPPRDYSREAPTGTSVSYAIRRLKDNRPDLYERVKAGELTAHGAMVTAGFKLRSITVDNDPARAARRLLKHFQGERLEALIRALREGRKDR